MDTGEGRFELQDLAIQWTILFSVHSNRGCLRSSKNTDAVTVDSSQRSLRVHLDRGVVLRSLRRALRRKRYRTQRSLKAVLRSGDFLGGAVTGVLSGLIGMHVLRATTLFLLLPLR